MDAYWAQKQGYGHPLTIIMSKKLRKEEKPHGENPPSRKDMRGKPKILSCCGCCSKLNVDVGGILFLGRGEIYHLDQEHMKDGNWDHVEQLRSNDVKALESCNQLQDDLMTLALNQ